MSKLWGSLQKPDAFLNDLKLQSKTSSEKVIALTDFWLKSVIRLNDFPYFMVGGRDKSFEHIADLPHSYILADGIEHHIGKKLPLWMVGMLY